MSVVNRVRISPTTGQAVSPAFAVPGYATMCASLPFGTNEGAKIQFTYDGSTWQDHYLNNVLQEIVPSHTMITIMGPGLFRVVKSATAAPIGITTWETEQGTP